MSKFRIYPTNDSYSPEEITDDNGTEVHRKIFSSYAAGIMTASDLQIIDVMLERIVCQIEDCELIEEEVGTIMDVIHGSERKMQDFHVLLGAFDVGEDGQLCKPESEKIDWGALKKDVKPKLRSVD